MLRSAQHFIVSKAKQLSRRCASLFSLPFLILLALFLLSSGSTTQAQIYQSWPYRTLIRLDTDTLPLYYLGDTATTPYWSSPRLTLDTLAAAMNCSGATGPGTAAFNAAITAFDRITINLQATDYATGTPDNTCYPFGSMGPVYVCVSTSGQGQFMVNKIINALGGNAPTAWYGKTGGALVTNQTYSVVNLPFDALNPHSPIYDTAPACSVVNGAIAGNLSDLQTLQSAFVSNSFFNTIGYQPYFAIVDSNGGGLIGPTYTGENVGTEALAFMIGGYDITALQTLLLGFQGNSDAQAILDIIFTYPPPQNQIDVATNEALHDGGPNSWAQFSAFFTSIASAVREPPATPQGSLGPPETPETLLQKAIAGLQAGSNATFYQNLCQATVYQSFAQYTASTPSTSPGAPQTWPPPWNSSNNAYDPYTFIGYPAVIFLQGSITSLATTYASTPTPPPTPSPVPATGQQAGSYGGNSSQSNWQNNGGGNTSSDDDDPACDNSDYKDPVLLDQFEPYPDHPCKYTRETRNLEFALNFKGGEQWALYFRDWVDNQFLQTLPMMAKQLTASIINQTREIGSAIDAKILSKTGATLQDERTDQQKAASPSELSCTAGSAGGAITTGTTVSNALAKGVQHDIQKHAQGADNSAGVNEGRLGELRERWDQYCTIFNDTSSNGGNTGCPNANGSRPNGDINIEEFMFKDTMDTSQAPDSIVVEALTRNLIQPDMDPKVTDTELLKSAIVREGILRQKHVRSARNIAANIVGGILSRREAGARTPLPPPPTPQPSPSSTVGGTPSGSFTDFLHQLALMESNDDYTKVNTINYIGKYQFGEPALVDYQCVRRDNKPGNNDYSLGFFDKCQSFNPVGSRSNFLNTNPGHDAQEAVVRKMMDRNWKQMQGWGLDKYVCKAVEGVIITPSGLLAGAHLMGTGGVLSFVKQNGKYPVCDSYGTCVRDYLTQKSGHIFAGYDTPYSSPAVALIPSSCSGITQNIVKIEPKSIEDAVQEIRQKAGTRPPLVGAATPPRVSYNEVMLTMTKERFFDPEYFIRLGDDLGSLKQEQASVQAYISIQMQDIYKLQEQINALLAARMGLEYGDVRQTNLTKEKPAN